MSVLNVEKTRDLLQRFDFKALFIEELGWSQPTGKQAANFSHDGVSYERLQIAQLSGVVVFEIQATDGSMPDAKARAALHKEISQHHHENLLIFIDQKRTQSLWYWVKREGTKTFPREHLYVQGQPGDLFLSKLGAMVVDISELDATGTLPVTEVATRLKKALDIERVTKKFFRDFDKERLDFLNLIDGVQDDRLRRWYASVLLNRLMFICFLQKKGFLDGGNQNYLHEKLAASKATSGEDTFFSVFLKALFFEGFAKPEHERSPEARKLLGSIKYLNGGLFLPHTIEQTNPGIRIPDIAFANLFELFQRYSWNLNDTPGGKDDEINPDVLGYIFEKYINQKAFGAYYTRPEITEYLCERTIYKLILDKVNTPGIPGVLAARRFDSIAELLLHLDADLCRELLLKVLPSLSLLDPACGSGAFLVAAMKTLINLYSAIIGRIKFLNDRNLTEWLKKVESEHKSIAYFIKKSIITDNLFGVDIMEEATEIAKLRLFLALVAAAQHVDELEPLPNIDFNILAGNSLIGLVHVDPAKFDAITATPANSSSTKKQDRGMVAEAPALDFGSFSTTERKDFAKEYRNQRTAETFSHLLAEKNRLIDLFRHTAGYTDDLRALRDSIEEKKKEAIATLNKILLEEFNTLGIKFEEATWDAAKNKEGKPNKRALTIKDIEALHPFHWGYEFDEILNKRGGFDAIITNPPWEIFKPQAKEFFAEHSELVTKKTMTIEEFEKEQTKLMKDADIRAAWIEYQSRFPHVSLYYRGSRQYKNQISIVNGKKAGSDINLYKLFTEQCFNLLRQGGECGIVIPSGIYTDLGTKQLREMLFAETEITGLFCFENRKEVFEGVHRSFKFVVLTFAKGGGTASFPTAFMRHDVMELARFPKEGALEIPVELIKRLSPDSLSVMEFKNDLDVRIAKKMLKFPLLGERIEGVWNVGFTAEFHMTNDSHLFKTEPGKGRLPLYEGKIIWHFDNHFREHRYWVDEKAGRAEFLGRSPDKGQKLDYQSYRLGFRDIAANTNERTMVSTIIPPAFHGNKLPTLKVYEEGNRVVRDKEQIFLCAIWNSFVIDAILRMKVTTTLNFFYIYQLPVPRLTEKDPAFRPIVERAARLICTTPEFDDLAREAGIGSHKKGVTDPVERARLRAELDGLIAHLYGLTEEEFAYILTTFPLVADPVKIAAQNAYRDVERGLIK
ncbi:MAG: hypothetical protein RBT64_00655 [Trichloromonas sp.]|jgi:hypothetical protein|nr:hypothetical protein [Trichloromonas sp.]